MLWWIIGGSLVGIAVLTVIYTTWAQRRYAPEVEAATREHFEKTGYTPVTPRNVNDKRLTAPRPLGTVEYLFASESHGNKVSTRGHWRLALTTPLPLGWQLVEHRIAPQTTAERASKSAADGVFRSSRSWSPLFPGPFTTGVEDVDARAHAFGAVPADVGRVLADPELRELLLACGEIDLEVTPHGVVLHDPTRFNLGALANAYSPDGSVFDANPAHGIRAETAAHLHVFRLLERCAQVTAAVGSTQG